MKSGLEGRNNFDELIESHMRSMTVSMKSGLEGRNNFADCVYPYPYYPFSLNEVRPGRPEQFGTLRFGQGFHKLGLNEVRPGRPEQFGPFCSWAPTVRCLNEVRPGRPEQFLFDRVSSVMPTEVSMKSGLEGRNNFLLMAALLREHYVSQ